VDEFPAQLPEIRADPAMTEADGSINLNVEPSGFDFRL
jgi:hypothetical protein